MASLERNGTDRWGALILIRETNNNGRFLIPDFSAGFQFRLIDELEYHLKANISRNSKIPTMNDLYWEPGGNPDLKNEYAYIYELTYEMKQKLTTPILFKYDLSLFHNNIRDMIQWHPGEYSYWTADNIQNAVSRGLESSLSLDYTSNHFKSVFDLAYTYNRATSVSMNENKSTSFGKQLMYIPENQANASLQVSFRGFYTTWIASMTGKRYISVDNTRFLPGYSLNNILTGMRLNFKGNIFDINFGIENLFNINYHTIAYYPLPGRSFSAKVLIQIIK
jgi:iron complex outermembrane receptor protein